MKVAARSAASKRLIDRAGFISKPSFIRGLEGEMKKPGAGECRRKL
jgi:hypothetical protein